MAPKFFCDNCNTEVGRDAKNCPGCGRFFGAVRCPSCGFSGDEKSFSGGCPSCGYSAFPSAALETKKAPSGKPFIKSKTLAKGRLPLWVYIVSVCGFIVTIALLVFILVR